MTPTHWHVRVGDETTTAVHDSAGSSTVFVCAHGAGGSYADRGVASTAKAMVAHGMDVVRFNFLYREKKSSRPDQMPRLMDTISAVADHVRTELRPARLILGGRSMGGRAASMLAADGFRADGLLLLAYPLHPPGQPEKLRDAHLPRISMRVLCIQGTRDTFCTPALMEKVLERVTAPWQMHWISGADHSFHVLKSTGRTNADVMNEIGDVSASWIGAA